MGLDLLFYHWGQPYLCRSSGLLGLIGKQAINDNLICKYDQYI